MAVDEAQLREQAERNLQAARREQRVWNGVVSIGAGLFVFFALVCVVSLVMRLTGR